MKRFRIPKSAGLALASLLLLAGCGERRAAPTEVMPLDARQDAVSVVPYPECPAGSGPVAGGQSFCAEIDPGDLARYEVAVLATLRPSDPPLGAGTAPAGAYTRGVFRVSYTAADGRLRTLSAPVEIDNLSGALRSPGGEAASLAEIFGSAALPAAPGSTARLSASLDLPVELFVANALLAAAETEYVTDRGTRVTVIDLSRRADPVEADVDKIVKDWGLSDKVTKARGGKPTWKYDCHGWTLAGGATWINDDQVQKVLDENGYAEKAIRDVRVGDLAVYRHGGAVTHTGIVVGTDPLTIESKWGSMGRYIHKPEDVPQGQGGFGGVPRAATYGTAKYYRSAREGGHQLKTK